MAAKQEERKGIPGRGSGVCEGLEGGGAVTVQGRRSGALRSGGEQGKGVGGWVTGKKLRFQSHRPAAEPRLLRGQDAQSEVLKWGGES